MRGLRRIAVSGDSAGGNLALVLLTLLIASGDAAPVAVAVLPPVTDLALTGVSFDTQAEAAPYFTRHRLKDWPVPTWATPTRRTRRAERFDIGEACK